MPQITEQLHAPLQVVFDRPPEVIHATPEASTPIDARREKTLRRLLDGPYGDGPSMGNLETARDSGLIDLFLYDEATGEDAIMHILSGDLIQGEDGATIVAGFHHEPSANYGEDTSNKTYVDREHLTHLNAHKRAEYTMPPFEPYKAKTVIAGRKKITLSPNPKTGERELVEAKSVMFPREYDGLAVLQAVRLAAQNRDPANDEVAAEGHKLAYGYAPMIDGESLMKIRLIFDGPTDKIVSAFPMAKVGGIMKLSDQAIDHALGLA